MTTTNRFYLNIGFLLIVTAVMIGLAVIPALASIQSIGTKIREQDQKLSQKQSSGFDIEKVKSELAAAARQETALNSVFVGQNKELELITQLEALAQKLGLSILVTPDLNLKPINNSVKRLPIKITASGSYLNVLKLVSDIEALDHYFNITRLTIKPKNNAAGLVTLEIEGQDYIYSAK